MNLNHNLKKVDRVNALLFIAIFMFFSLRAIAGSAQGDSWALALLGVIPNIIMALCVYFLPLPRIIKSHFYPVLPMLTTSAMFIVFGLSLERHLIIVMTIAMAGLYFNKRLLMTQIILVNMSYSILYALYPTMLLGDDASLVNFLAILVLIDIIGVGMYMINVWGSELICASVVKERALHEANESMSLTFSKISSSSRVLSDSIKGMAQATSDSSRSIDEVAKTMKEITLGVQEQTSSVSKINAQTNHIAEDVNRAKSISKDLANSNELMFSKVNDGEAKMLEFSSQMLIVDETIEMTTRTVAELGESVEDIIKFLDVIQSISSQTNLLALNASIESARAGEAGKGFAVVADEIRKLAEQSAMAVGDIQKIVGAFEDKTKSAINAAENGVKAVEDGNSLIKKIAEEYSNMKLAVDDSSGALSHEMDCIEKIHANFAVMKDDVNTIASISEEHAASTEEVLATVENQNDSISLLANGINEIKKLGEALAEMALDGDSLK